MRLAIYRASSCRAIASLAGLGFVFLFSAPPACCDGVAAKLVFNHPSNARVNTPLEPALEVQVQDAEGQRVGDYQGEVTLALKPGAGSTGALLLGTLTIAVADGYAVFPDLRIDTGGVHYVLVATSGSLPPAESFPIHVTTETVRVKPNGDDGNDGSTWEMAKRTLGAAVLQVDRQGGSVWLANGDYQESVLAEGEPTSHLEFSVLGGFQGTEASPGERPPGPGNTKVRSLEAWYDCWLTLDSLSVNSLTLRARSQAMLRGGRLDGAEVGGGSGLGAEDSTIGSVSCMDENNGVSLTRCLVTGTLSTWDVSSIYAYDTWFLGGGFWLSVGHATVESCLFTGRDIAVDVGGMGGALLENSTFVGNGTVVRVSMGTVKCVNSIFAFNGRGFALNPDYPGESPDITVQHSCLWENSGGDFEGLTPTLGPGNLTEDPRFVDRAVSNYRLAENSPCIDAGENSVVETGDVDLDGRRRILGARTDMGAYEAAIPWTFGDASDCLAFAAGLAASTPADRARLDVALGASTGRLEIEDALLLARKAAGLDPNP